MVALALTLTPLLHLALCVTVGIEPNPNSHPGGDRRSLPGSCPGLHRDCKGLGNNGNARGRSPGLTLTYTLALNPDPTP